MTTPQRLASEDVIINAPLSYAGSAQRIFRIRRVAGSNLPANVAITALAVVLVVAAWLFVTGWYMTWGLFLVPYRLLRRGARKRKAEALRHRETLGAIGGDPPAALAAAAVAPAVLVEAPPDVPMLGDASAAIFGESTVEPSVEREGA
ncbi:MAG TPA: hypothetical protein VHU61_08515 [Solirubrobacteraceae bacterium]|jgi:hypothetical protein|nr:hypothetical protein [Solirubrobacteraceae bacterium]